MADPNKTQAWTAPPTKSRLGGHTTAVTPPPGQPPATAYANCGWLILLGVILLLAILLLVVAIQLAPTS